MKDAKGHGSDPRGGAVVRLDTVGSPAKKTGFNAFKTPKGVAKQEQVAKANAVDESHFPPSTITDRMAAMSLGQGHPKSYVAPLGSSFAQAQDQLDRARNLALPRGTPGRRKS